MWVLDGKPQHMTLCDVRFTLDLVEPGGRENVAPINSRTTFIASFDANHLRRAYLNCQPSKQAIFAHLWN